MLAFLVVFREGFETVLFYEALLARAQAGVGGSVVWSGFACGAVLLAIIGTALFRYGIRIPIRPFFAVTGVLLYVLAFKFAGGGVRELQEAGWVSVTAIAMPELPWLRDWLAIYPFVEPLLLQGLLLLAVVGRRRLRLRDALGSESRGRSGAFVSRARAGLATVLAAGALGAVVFALTPRVREDLPAEFAGKRNPLAGDGRGRRRRAGFPGELCDLSRGARGRARSGVDRPRAAARQLPPRDRAPAAQRRVPLLPRQHRQAGHRDAVLSRRARRDRALAGRELSPEPRDRAATLSRGRGDFQASALSLPLRRQAPLV